jgi:hypothetical protein
MTVGAYQKCERMGHGQRSGLHLSNARKDTLQLRFSKMGISYTLEPNAIVAQQGEVEI